MAITSTNRNKTPAKTPTRITTSTNTTTRPAATRTTITAEERNRLIAEAAYFRAEARGWAPGHELEDWVEAECEVTRRMGNGSTR